MPPATCGAEEVVLVSAVWVAVVALVSDVGFAPVVDGLDVAGLDVAGLVVWAGAAIVSAVWRA